VFIFEWFIATPLGFIVLLCLLYGWENRNGNRKQ
jgi:hypothetical protein